MSSTPPKFLITLMIVLIVGVLYSLHLLPERQYTDADFDITTYHSQVDRDNDGLDDQADILASVRSYLATSPKYQSKYYASGYPDDEYGVCTDVVAQGLKGAGYDIKTLLDQDVAANPHLYDIEIRDPNIDFRRVKNLEVYLRHNAINLTINLDVIAEWQGGDIVVFKDHIGIISDHRNARGVPFLIHHYSPAQLKYEEDALEAYADQIIGHYRIS